MNCALWLNKRKVQHASEIRKNLDVASLRGYFLAGSLVEWLRENGGEKYAEKLSKISADDPELNQKIAKVFGGKPVPSKPLQTASERQDSRFGAVTPSSAANYGSGSFSYLQLSSFGELQSFLLNFGTSSFGSLNFGSYSLWELFWRSYGSFRFGSFSSFYAWEWEWLFALFGQGYGSFRFGSFSSFREWEWEWLLRLFRQGYGSFRFGSFSSFHEWEWEWLLRLFGGSFSSSGFGSYGRLFWSGIFGSFGGLGSFGSLNGFADITNFPILDEYDRIMLETLIRCPLDRFGYGVHNI